jgi:hypothetical protein
MAEVGRPTNSLRRAVPRGKDRAGQAGTQDPRVEDDNRAVCGNSRRQPMDDHGPGTVTCESCALDTGHHMVSSSPARNSNFSMSAGSETASFTSTTA